MIGKNFIIVSTLVLAGVVHADEPALAEAGASNCPYVSREQYDAIDMALPCVNFRLHNPEFQGSRFLRESMRQGVYNELVQRNQLESSCKANAYAEKLNSDSQMDDAYEEIAARFVHYRPAFRSLREARQQDNAAVMEGRDCRSESCWSREAAEGAQFSARDAERNRQRDQLIARIPYGFEPHVADAIRQLDAQLPDNFPEGATQEQINLFRSKLRDAFYETQRAYNASNEHFRSLFRATDCAVQETPTSIRHIAVPEELAGRTCPAGQTPVGGSYLQEDGTWRALSQSGAITGLAREITSPSDARFQSILQNSLNCNADPYAQRQANLSSFAIATGALALVPGVGLLVVTGISAYVYSQQVMHSCFGGQATGFRVVDGLACTQGMGLDGAVHSADSTDCGRDVLTAVGAVAFSGAVGTTRRLLSGAEGVLGGAGTAAVRNADNVVGAATSDVASSGARVADDAGENVIVVNGTRPQGRSGRRASDRRRPRDAEAPSTTRRPETGDRTPTAGAASAADEVAEAGEARVAGAAAAGDAAPTPGGRVPANTSSRRLVDQNIDNADVRLSEDQMRALQEETFNRKADIDRIIGRQNRNINDEHTALNEALDSGQLDRYIRERGLNAADARQLRESIEILQRERTVLTRARVNEDLDVLAREGAEVRTVPCDPVNGLNGTPAFHTAARCSVVRFRTAVENYCSCGARGSLGSWAGPCANALTDYLSGGQLADRDALPSASASALRECKRIRIPAGTTVVHGGLRPTFSGHGGAAQIFLPTRAFAARGDDTARLVASREARGRLGISDDAITGADEIEIVAVAPVSPNRELTELFDAGRVCRQNPNGCTRAETERFAEEYQRFTRANPGRVTNEERAQFQEWHDWIRGCRIISPTRGGSTFGPFDPTRPGCRSRVTF